MANEAPLPGAVVERWRTALVAEGLTVFGEAHVSSLAGTWGPEADANAELHALLKEGHLSKTVFSGAPAFWWSSKRERLLMQIEHMKEVIESLEKGGYEETVQRHITRLHRYNEAKDAGQMLLGRLEVNGVRTVDMYKEFGLEVSD